MVVKTNSIEKLEKLPIVSTGKPIAHVQRTLCSFVLTLHVSLARSSSQRRR